MATGPDQRDVGTYSSRANVGLSGIFVVGSVDVCHLKLTDAEYTRSFAFRPRSRILIWRGDWMQTDHRLAEPQNFGLPRVLSSYTLIADCNW
jgi:hypothetical protein